MNNTLSDLNNYLFEQIERLQDDELSEEQMQREIVRAGAITKIGETIIRNGELALKTMQHLNEYAYGRIKNDSELAPVPPMLEARHGETV